MLKVHNKKAIRWLSDRTLIVKKKKYLVAIFAIMLTTVLFTTFFTIGGSILKSMQDSMMRQVGGSAHASLKCILPSDYEVLSKDEDVKSSSYRIVIAAAENEALKKLNTEINYAQDENAQSGFCYPSVGTMPKNRLDLVTSSLVLKALGIPCELGETVTLTFTVHGETITQDFTLCGYWTGDRVAMAQQCFVSREYCDEVAPTPNISFYEAGTYDYAGYWMMDLDFSNTWNIEKKMMFLLYRNGYQNGTIGFGINWAYTSSEVDPVTVITIITILGIIMASGYLLIYNIFYINVTADIRSYGLLKTIGTTGRQLKRIVLRQAFILSIIAIPIGLILGAVIGRVLVPLAVSAFEVADDMIVSIHPVIFIGSAVFTLLTVYMSCIKPCKIAAKVSPIEALRYTETQGSVKNKQKKTTKLSPITMARANMRKSRKKVIIVILSLSMSMILLNSIYAVVNGFDIDKYVSNSIIGDAMVMDASVLNPGMGKRTDSIDRTIQQDFKTADSVETISNIYYMMSVANLNDIGYQNVLKIIEDYPERFRDSSVTYEIDSIKEEKKLRSAIYGIDQFGLSQFIACTGTIDWELFSTGKYIIVNKFSTSDDMDSSAKGMFYDVGDQIQVELFDGTIKEYEVMAIAATPYAMTCRYSTLFGLEVVLPQQEYLAHAENQGALMSVLTVKEGELDLMEAYLQDYTENDNTNLTYVAKQNYIDEFNEFRQMYMIIGGALSFILALIGILNFMNSIVTTILTRKQEFAMIEAVGMTGKQLKAMLAWEGLIYAFYTIFFSCTIGLVVSYVLVQLIAGEIWFFTWHFTILPIMICAPILCLISYLIPIMAYKGMCRESIVERIRMIV